MHVNIDAQPAKKPQVSMIKHPEFVELRNALVVSRVKVLNTEPPMTVTYTVDEGDKTSYAARTEHDCATNVSTLKYLAVYDSEMKLVEESTVEMELDIEPGSLGEAELTLACNNTKGTV